METYTTLGGTPLDRQYTVFGECGGRPEVVERIQNCDTTRNDRPRQDISMSVEVVESV